MFYFLLKILDFFIFFHKNLNFLSFFTLYRQFLEPDIELIFIKSYGGDKMIKERHGVIEDNFNIDVTYPLLVLNRTKEDILDSIVFIASHFKLDLEAFIYNNKLFIKVAGYEKEINKFKFDILTFPYFGYR